MKSESFVIHADTALVPEMTETAWSRADENYLEARNLAMESEWMWGSEGNKAIFDTPSVRHSLTGEVDMLGSGYRARDYHVAADIVSKEMIPDFGGFVRDTYDDLLDKLQAEEDGRPMADRLVDLDHLKQYGLALFHAIQYPARTERMDDEQYEQSQRMSRSATHAVRAFYLGLLGHHDRVKDELTASKFEFENVDPSVLDNIPRRRFKGQELDQPLTIIGSSLLACEAYPDTDLIYAIAAGGSQLGIVTQLLYELKRNGDTDSSPEIAFLPISTHSVKEEALVGIISGTTERVLSETSPSGRHVLICEDNSNTGTTISLAYDAIQASSPEDLHVVMAEFDPIRIAVKNRAQNVRTIITNYKHADFASTVGIVPITRGRYPDIQMRKTIALKRSLQPGAAESIELGGASYDEIERQEFEAFDDIYRSALIYVGDEHGYRNPYIVAGVVLREMAEKGMLEPSLGYVQPMAKAAISYPYLPADVQARLAERTESLDFDPARSGWLRQGARHLLETVMAASEAAGTSPLIWTKGDGSRFSNPPYPGAMEQQKRFELSGLSDICAETAMSKGSSFEFIAHPEKVRLLSSRILPDMLGENPELTSVVIIDDSEKNIAEAAQVTRRFGLEAIPINPLDKATDRTRLDELAEIFTGRAWPNTGFIVDMDDTLLHENFRRYHQPRNMYLALHETLSRK